MGDRGAGDVVANAEERAAMGAIVKEAISAGAVGFTTSRTVLHRSIEGETVPGTNADALELLTIAKSMCEAGSAVFEVATDLAPESNEFSWMDRIIDEMKCPVTYACVQNDIDPGQWQRLVDYAGQRPPGMYPQVAIRPPGMLICLEGSHPFVARPSYKVIANQ